MWKADETDVVNEQRRKENLIEIVRGQVASNPHCTDETWKRYVVAIWRRLVGDSEGGGENTEGAS